MVLKKIKKDKYFYLGIFFFVLQILVFLRNYITDSNPLFFYYCDNIALFLSYACFKKNIQLIKGLINVGFILQLIYAIDLIFEILFNYTIYGGINRLFEFDFFYVFTTLLMHFMTTFLVLPFVVFKANKIESLKYSFYYLLFLYITTLLFTAPIYDMNCVFGACGVELLYFNYFTYFWLPIAFLGLVIPTYFLQKILY